ncbi:MAG: hypothetical protein ACOYO1_18895 [Bacteroidales bacterium]
MITIPCEYEYVTDDPNIRTVPFGYIDKTICGCGLTSLAIESEGNTVITVPTIYLTTNKAKQYPSTRYTGSLLPVWGDTSVSSIEQYVQNNNPAKIMVTYDSLFKVEHLLPKARLIIDESNELLSKSKLKPEVIDNLFDIAERYKDTVSFISATPIPLEFMPRWISDIDQVKITFKDTIKTVPILCKRTYPFKSLKDEIINPLLIQNTITFGGKTFDKVLVFVNSVIQVAKIVKECKIDKNECGIICGNSLENDTKIIGIPRYNDDTLPKFLFATSSAYCGIDLYDASVMSIVVSCTTKKWQMIDMMTDLKQAISRQRNKDNPNYGSYIYIYNQSIFEKTDDELLKILDDVHNKITTNIGVYEDLLRQGKAKYFMFDADFKSYTIFKDNKYEINRMAFNADKYFILNTRKQYTKGFDVQGSLGKCETVEAIEIPYDFGYPDLVEYFNENHINGTIDWKIYSSHYDWTVVIENSFRLYNKTWKDYTYARKMIENFGNVNQQVIIEIKSKFRTGNRYSRKEVRSILSEIYSRYNIKRVAKYTDLSEIMTVKNIIIRGDRIIEIINKSY